MHMKYRVRNSGHFVACVMKKMLMSRYREIHVQTFPVVLKFDKLLGHRVVEMPVKFQSDAIIITHNSAV